MIRALLFACLAWVFFAASPTAGADPSPGATTDPAANVVTDVCARFGAALHHAASNYDEFAYATAGRGDVIDYADRNVQRTNVIGRAALREAAQSALLAARTPGLPPEVSDSIKAWSVQAAKLLVVMGLRGGGDYLNATAAQLNADAYAAQMACARHGGRA